MNQMSRSNFCAIAAIMALGAGFAFPQDSRCDTGRRRLAQLQVEVDAIAANWPFAGQSPEQVQMAAGRARKLYSDALANARRGYIESYFQKTENRRSDAKTWKVEWSQDYNQDFAAYFQEMLNATSKQLANMNRLPRIQEEMEFQRQQLRELNCDSTSNQRPGVKQQPASVGLVLTKTDVKKNGQSVYAPYGKSLGGEFYTFTASTATIDHTRINATGSLEGQIQTFFQFTFQTVGDGRVLRPGDKVKVTIDGADTRTPANYGLGWGVVGEMSRLYGRS